MSIFMRSYVKKHKHALYIHIYFAQTESNKTPTLFLLKSLLDNEAKKSQNTISYVALLQTTPALRFLF